MIPTAMSSSFHDPTKSPARADCPTPGALDAGMSDLPDESHARLGSASACALVTHLGSYTGETSHMPRKPNYGFDKRRKEQERKAKKDAKKLDRQQRRDEAASTGGPADGGSDAAESSLPVPPDEES
jgi:hypothetical protein